MLGELLADKMRKEEGYHAAMESFLATGSSPLPETAGADRPYPSRSSLRCSSTPTSSCTPEMPASPSSNVAWYWLEALWRERRGCLNFQVSQEY
jgi:hypothetical protein